MADRRTHLGDELVDLVLGQVDGRRRIELSAHLLACATCRAEYDALSRSMADVIEAVPPVQPPVGFDAAVLHRLTGSAPATRTRDLGTRRRRQWLMAAAAAVLLLVAVGAVLATRGDDGRTATVVPLRAVDGGHTVGTVSLGSPAGDPVLVVAVVDAPPDVSYTCRMRMRDGSIVESDPWPATERGAWIVDVPRAPDELDRIELVVTGTDQVWSTAML